MSVARKIEELNHLISVRAQIIWLNDTSPNTGRAGKQAKREVLQETLLSHGTDPSNMAHSVSDSEAAEYLAAVLYLMIGD